MPRKTEKLNADLSEHDFSLDRPLFRKQLKDRFLKAAGCGVRLDDEELDMLNAAGLMLPEKPEKKPSD